MISNFIRRLVLFLIAFSVLTACDSQAAKVQTTPSGFLLVTDPAPSLTSTSIPTSIGTATPSLTPTSKPTVTCTATATPCLGFVATPVSTPLPWSYADDYWDKLAVSRIPVQGLECAAPQEIVSELVLQWLETIKTTSSRQILHCGLEDYTLEKITIVTNTITPQYDIVAGVFYHVKPGRFGDCGWISGRGILEKDGWIGDYDFFGVNRENGYFRLKILPGWGT